MWNEPLDAAVCRRASTYRNWTRSVDRAITYMHGHFDQPCRIGMLAETAFSSPFHFVRTFQTVTGLTPAQYLAALRLQEAKRRLVTTDAPVTEICLDVGYSSLGTFIRRFKALVGVTPCELRQLRRMLDRESTASLRARLSAAVRPAARALPEAIAVKVTAAEDVDGLIFVGAFPGGRFTNAPPAACGVLVRPGSVNLQVPADGHHQILGVSFAWGTPASEFLIQDPHLRGRAASLGAPASVHLRPSTVYDPPVLPSLTGLLIKRVFGTRIAAPGEVPVA